MDSKARDVTAGYVDFGQYSALHCNIKKEKCIMLRQKGKGKFKNAWTMVIHLLAPSQVAQLARSEGSSAILVNRAVRNVSAGDLHALVTVRDFDGFRAWLFVAIFGVSNSRSLTLKHPPPHQVLIATRNNCWTIMTRTLPG